MTKKPKSAAPVRKPDILGESQQAKQVGGFMQMQSKQEVKTIFDPEIVRQYSEMVQDAPERILKIFEENNRVERSIRERPFQESKRRDWMGYSLTVSILAATCFFAYIDKPWLYGTTLIVFLGIVVKNFIVRK
jgi:hypothetical protein